MGSNNNKCEESMIVSENPDNNDVDLDLSYGEDRVSRSQQSGSYPW